MALEDFDEGMIHDGHAKVRSFLVGGLWIPNGRLLLIPELRVT